MDDEQSAENVESTFTAAANVLETATAPILEPETSNSSILGAELVSESMFIRKKVTYESLRGTIFPPAYEPRGRPECADF